jgi:CDGSH-type Zn-finger protein
MAEKARIEIIGSGPLLVYGNIPLYDEVYKNDAMGKPIKWVKGKAYVTDDSYILCRCGDSTNKPFCSGAHLDSYTDFTETAKNDKYDDTCIRHEGCDGVVLLEKPILCTGAGFCHSGRRIENYIKKSKTIDTAKQQAFDCPGGGLTLVINGVKQEPQLEKEISVTTDAGREGPLWVKGGIPVISVTGEEYEVRNRVALCRCGKSKNKPFCDSSHLD